MGENTRTPLTKHVARVYIVHQGVGETLAGYYPLPRVYWCGRDKDAVSTPLMSEQGEVAEPTYCARLILGCTVLTHRAAGLNPALSAQLIGYVTSA